MGIREHLGEKVAEKEVKLSDLSMDIAEKKHGFDFEEIITDKNKKRLMNFVRAGLRQGIGRYRQDIVHLNILYPEDVGDILFEDEQVRKNLISLYKKTKSRADMSRCLDIAVSFRKLFPEYSNELELGNDDFEYLQTTIGYKMPERLVNSVFTEIFQARILFPNRFDEINLDDIVWSKKVEYLDGYKKSGHWDSFVTSAAEMKIVFGERFKDYEISKKDWEGMFAYAGSLRKEERDFLVDHTFLEYLANLKILLADRVVIEKDKFEVVMPGKEEDFKQEKKPRPERKTF